MEQELRNYIIESPEVVLGEVLGKLNALGACLVGGSESADGNVRIEATIPADKIEVFRSWFANATDGKGSVS